MQKTRNFIRHRNSTNFVPKVFTNIHHPFKANTVTTWRDQGTLLVYAFVKTGEIIS